MSKPVATSVVVRAPIDEDLPAIAELVGQLGYPVTADQVRERLRAIAARGEQELFVAEVDGRVAGIAAVQVSRVVQMEGPRGELATLITDGRVRRRGVARALVAACEDGARRAGCELFFLRTNKRRSESHEFYRALGFEETHLAFNKAL